MLCFEGNILSSGQETLGTIDASIYAKNNFQDNSKYIIKKSKQRSIQEMTPIDLLRKAIGEGKDVPVMLNIVETCLRIVQEGVMTIEEAVSAIKDIREELYNKGDAYEEICIVRRLIPTETSRLQGFPDDYTKIDGPDTPDSPQFKGHGNSWATPCANFISTRIEMELRRMGHKNTILYATVCSGIEAQSVAVKNLDWGSLFFSEIEPFPCRVLAHHYPEVPNLGDMTQIRFDKDRGVITNQPTDENYTLDSCFLKAPIREIPFKEGDLDVFSGGTPCFTAGHMVLTIEGYKPIEKIRVGDEVITHLGNMKKVVAIGKKRADNIVRMKARTRYAIEVTDNHPFWSMIGRRDFRRSSSTYLKVLLEYPMWREVGSLSNKNFVSLLDTDTVNPQIPVPNFPKVYTATKYDIAELIGWYIGDGYIRRFKGKSKKALILCLSKKKLTKFRSVFSGILHWSETKERTAWKIHIYCTELANFIEHEFGRLSHEKRIPAWMIFAPSELKDRFISGYLSTDGTRTDREERWSTTSSSLAFGMAQLLNESCVSFHKVSPRGIIEGRVVNQRDIYSVNKRFGKKDLHKYGIWNFVRVQKIEPIEPSIVYNIEVEGDHSYICNGYCVHNCTDVSVAGKREGMAEGSETRSALAWHYQRIIDEIKPTFTIWENVPGIFSSNGGKDFIWFVNRCAESGYAIAWRVLDAQYTMTEEFPRAVPQRRRRVWMVGYKGNDWRIPARVCFELSKDLTSKPPERVPGRGFQTLTTEVTGQTNPVRGKQPSQKEEDNDSLFGLIMESDDGRKDLLKVSKMIDFSEMPDEADFSKVPMTSIYEFAKKVGVPGYIGDVFRKDKKQPSRRLDDTLDLFNMNEVDATKVGEAKMPEDEEWIGAEKIAPAILESIGNAGILANGRICTMVCPEWTSGLQLTPKTYSAWEVFVQHKEWLKANDLLPEAYDETVCGLSDVLEEEVDEKYNLSWRACYGILRRAETRGKELPAPLYVALVSTIRENAGIVKWVVLNGKTTKKKETDVTEREAARICFDKYITPVLKFDDVIPEEPKKRTEEEEAEDELELTADNEEDETIDEDGNPIEEEQ